MSKMDDVETIRELKDLKQFLNEKGIMEIVVRYKNKKFKTFQKVMISNLGETKEKALAEKVIQALNKTTKLSEKNLKLLGRVAKLEKFGLMLNGLNLCSTCTGFAIMYAKLDKMSADINRKLSQLHKTMKQTQDLHNSYEFNKVLSDHTDMLDSQRRQQPYSEGKMRELVDREYNVLNLLISSFQKDVSDDKGALIFSIISLLAMLTASLKAFDEMYYFNNHDALGKTNIWHLSHDKWMGVYDVLNADWFVEKLQDYAAFETDLSTIEVDKYYTDVLDQVAYLKEEVEDNQALIVAMEDLTDFNRFKEMSTKEVLDSIEAAYIAAGTGMDEAVIMNACQDALQKTAMV